jgi:hypothetical protein
LYLPGGSVQLIVVVPVILSCAARTESLIVSLAFCESAGHEALEPVQLSVGSHVAAEGRQTVPAATNPS